MFLKKDIDILAVFFKINKYKDYLSHIWIPPGGYFLYLIFLNNIFFLSRSHFHEGKPRIMQVTKQIERIFFKVP